MKYYIERDSNSINSLRNSREKFMLLFLSFYSFFVAEVSLTLSMLVGNIFYSFFSHNKIRSSTNDDEKKTHFFYLLREFLMRDKEGKKTTEK
jgi:hypothetical protein